MTKYIAQYITQLQQTDNSLVSHDCNIYGEKQKYYIETAILQTTTQAVRSMFRAQSAQKKITI